MIYRIFPSKDNWITSFVLPFVNIPATGSNFGQSEILELFKKAGNTGAGGWAGSSSLGRVLLQFDITTYQNVSASFSPGDPPTWRLCMRDAQHGQTLPSSYDVQIRPITRQWDEGQGLDAEKYIDKGQSNWVQARSNSYWTTPGGDFTATGSTVVSFDTGYEDLNADVTTAVRLWISGTLTNYGFGISVSSTLEQNSLDYYVKKFHGRSTNFLDRRPYLEASWDDSKFDNRSNFVFDVSGTLFLYNNVRGTPTNITGVPTGQNCLTVRISDLSGTVITTSASWTGQTGVYSASFLIPSASYSGSYMTDVWFSGSRVYMSGTFSPTDGFADITFPIHELDMEVSNLKSEYSSNDTPRLRVFTSTRDYNPPYVLTASLQEHGVIVEKCYYAIDNDKTKERVVSFGTGSYIGGKDSTRLSYDSQGNYFDFPMSNLSPGNVYKIVFFVDRGGERRVVDCSNKFKVM